MSCWYVVFCKPRQEVVAQANLEAQGFEVYLPRVRTRQFRRQRWVGAVEVLFPRYVFLRLDPQCQSTDAVRSTRGAVGLVRFGGFPATVPERVIATLKQREDEDTGLHPDDRVQFKEGGAVRLIDGPLGGIEGVFSQYDGDERVIVLLELLGKANKVVVNRDWVARAA
jgi:transcriptional antiterminator RfaH